MDALPLSRYRRLLAAACFLVLATLSASAATVRSTNFSVDAPTAEAARAIAQHAESCRISIARAWLGHEMPDWKRPCPIKVKLTQGEAGGLTTFSFAGNQVSDQEIELEGRLDRILASALPHEVTHTVFAAFFGGPMPRWADEGASLLSEDLREIQRHDRIVADLFTRRGEYALQQLFSMEEYPRDLMGFYGQGYSVSRFLVEIGGRPRFLEFVRDGLQKSWDEAAQTHYGLASCRELDRAWRSWYAVAYNEHHGPTDNALLARAPQNGN